MTQPRVVSRDEWEAARAELLVSEKELTRARDALSAQRRRLPMVRIDKEYVFDSPDGPVDLPGLFDGDFNPDFGATSDDAECSGLSVFLRDGADVFHTYSSFSRGGDALINTYNYLGLTALGRQEEGLEHPQQWWRHHDRYDVRRRETRRRDASPARATGNSPELEVH
ncbi:DUF899 family protein [Micromonospora sp. NPDC047812]|uniref:DUF899 family protein n=1 Tax=Micromonospora sp. NPDC047812 TaxID=3155742 RepID=UPI003455FCE5